MIKYTEEQKQFLIDNNYMKPAQELAEMFNKQFGTSITASNIKIFRGNNKLNSGLTGRFEKGHISHNKGKKWNDYMSKEKQEKSLKTTFKKGNVPHNHKPIGYERISVDGYIEIKVKEPNIFKLKHRVIWEEHFGSIPNGYNVIFKDRNKLNLDINNLALVSKAQMLILNQEKLIYDNPNLTEVGINISKIKERVSDIKNGL